MPILLNNCVSCTTVVVQCTNATQFDQWVKILSFHNSVFVTSSRSPQCNLVKHVNDRNVIQSKIVSLNPTYSFEDIILILSIVHKQCHFPTCCAINWVHLKPKKNFISNHVFWKFLVLFICRFFSSEVLKLRYTRIFLSWSNLYMFWELTFLLYL